MNTVLIDSDVLLDFFYDHPVFGPPATSILRLCESGQIIGYVTPVILSNVYYILRKGSSHARVISKLSQLLSITRVLTMDEKATIQALNSKFKDFEDALQNYAAELNGKIEVIVTRNLKDYKESELLIMPPNDYLKARSTRNR